MRLILGVFAVGCLFLIAYHMVSSCAQHAPVVAVVQIPEGQGMLPTRCLVELMDLSIDGRDFISQEKERALMDLNLFHKVSLKKLSKKLVLITYHLREPVAYVGNWSNTLIDAEGVCFPAAPYFSPKDLPTLYLPDNYVSDDLVLCKGMRMLDLTHMHDRSLGTREIVVEMDNGDLLRLDPESFCTQLAHYGKLSASVDRPSIYDLRMTGVAYVHTHSLDLSAYR